MSKPFGLWPSPITPRSLAGDTRIFDVQWDSDGTTLVWLEGRSDRGVLCCAPWDGSDAPRDLTVDLSVRARVGYGGGDFTVGGGVVFFVESESGRIYRQALSGGPARPITPAFGMAAAPTIAPDGSRVLYVHSYEGHDVLALVDAGGRQWPHKLVSGHDFYMQPCWHPDGRRFAYVAWDHPQMPWDGALLYLATIGDNGEPEEVRLVAGDTGAAIFQPSFSPDGRYLAYVSDASGWGQIWLYDLAGGAHSQLSDDEAEYGEPAWVQGLRSYGWGHDSRHLYCLRNTRGFRALLSRPLAGPAATLSAGESYTWFQQVAVAPGADRIAVIASSSTIPPRLVVAEGGGARVLRRTSTETVAPAMLAEARPISWAAADGAQVHGLLYLPPGVGQPGETALPPAVVRIHGGPTSQAVASYNQAAQFFATRGYAVLDVNYRGSTGYGRAYMEALRGRWGICDVEDAVSGARHLAAAGLADGGRIVIMGGSAGGYTVLEALCRAPGVFRAGICMYGVANLFALAADTHKFEERYLDSLVGPLPAAAALYRERSPLFHADLLQDPIAVFQGEIDQVVPRAQSDSIVESLRRRGVPHEYHIYAGEGHGWRKSETIEAFYAAVERFLRQHALFA